MRHTDCEFYLFVFVWDSLYIDEFGMIYKRNIKPYKVNVMEDTSEPFRDIKFLPSPGHTPGHTTIEVVSKGERLVIVGDAWFSQPDQVRNPDWSFTLETNAEDALISRTEIFEKAAKRKDLVVAYHEAFPGLGYVVKTQSAFDWIPRMDTKIKTGARSQCQA